MEAYQGAPAVVLGAGGFIGRWVTRLLCTIKADVVPVVRKRSSAAQVLAELGAVRQPLECDLAESWRLRELIAGIRPAVVFNLAGYGVRHDESDPTATFQINAHMPEKLAEALAALPPDGWQGQRLVHAGSALEYGIASGNLREDTPPQPTTVYGRSKLEGTRVLSAQARATGLRAIVARLFTVYGPGEHPGRLVPSLIYAAQHRIPLQLTSGSQNRDFTYVEDVANGLLRLGVARVEPGEVVNLATGRLTPVCDLVRIAAGMLDIPLEHLCFGTISLRFPEMDHQPVDVGRLQQLTGWIPSTTVEEGIQKTARFLKAYEMEASK